MRKRKERIASDIVMQVLRLQGLETPLLQRRLINAWDDVVGETVARYTREKFIKNQTLMVKIDHPALKADLNMMRTSLKDRLNIAVGAQVIADVRIYRDSHMMRRTVQTCLLHHTKASGQNHTSGFVRLLAVCFMGA